MEKTSWLTGTFTAEKDGFTGHDEIDIRLKQPVKSLYLHGRDLDMKRAVAMVGGQAVPATFVQPSTVGEARKLGDPAAWNATSQVVAAAAMAAGSPRCPRKTRAPEPR